MSPIKVSQVFVSKELRRNAHLSIIKRFLNRQALGQGENWEAGYVIITSLCLSQAVISSEAAIRTLHPTHVFLPATLNMRDLGDSCHILAPWYLTSISPTVGCDTSDCSA